MKRSVSLAIYDAEDRLLIVQRPPDDEDLPDVWGLPAASLRSGESWDDAALRAARDKLGIEIDGIEWLHAGSQQRGDAGLEMRLARAQIVNGEPDVPQPDASVTQYVAWRWGTGDELVPGAERGSLCCRLLLEYEARRPRS